MADPQARVEEMIARLRAQGLRLTPQRMAVVQVLADSDGHPSVEQVYEVVHRDLPMTSLATVYKTVNLLRDVGQVLELGFGDGGNRYDGNKPYPHPHLVCVRCRAIMDLELDALDGLPQQVSQDTGYQIVSHRLDLFGICPQCLERERRREPHGTW